VRRAKFEFLGSAIFEIGSSKKESKIQINNNYIIEQAVEPFEACF
jgi:hypothetical protein